jgi:hypothetical protein
VRRYGVSRAELRNRPLKNLSSETLTKQSNQSGRKTKTGPKPDKFRELDKRGISGF